MFIMKNKFDINSEEVKRILSLHEDATKNQYLNVISEIGAGGEGDSNFFNPKPTTNNPQSSQNKTIKYDDGTYTGPLKNNKPEGKGTLKYPDGTYYTGNFINGRFHGKGTMKWKTKDYYSGDWKNNEKDGKGTYKWSDGTYYVGDWRKTMMTGKGTYQNILKVKFYGDWEGDKFNCNGKKVNTKYLDTLKTNTCNPQQQNQQGQVQRQQQFVQQVQQYNTQIQTSLGVQQPTGQITTNDIDTIMKKLG